MPALRKSRRQAPHPYPRPIHDLSEFNDIIVEEEEQSRLAESHAIRPAVAPIPPTRRFFALVMVFLLLAGYFAPAP